MPGFPWSTGTIRSDTHVPGIPCLLRSRQAWPPWHAMHHAGLAQTLADSYGLTLGVQVCRFNRPGMPCTTQLQICAVQTLVSHIHSASLQAQLRDEEELSNLISAKMHMRTDAPAFRQTREG